MMLPDVDVVELVNFGCLKCSVFKSCFKSCRHSWRAWWSGYSWQIFISWWPLANLLLACGWPAYLGRLVGWSGYSSLGMSCL